MARLIHESVATEREFAQVLERECERKNYYKGLIIDLQKSVDEAQTEIDNLLPELLTIMGEFES